MLNSQVYIVFVLINCVLSSEIEFKCEKCTKTNSMVYIKSIWWPTADPEFSCVKVSDVSSYIGLVIDISCSPSDCWNFPNRLSSNIWNNHTQPCIKIDDFSSFKKYKLVADITEIVVFLFFITVSVYKGEHVFILVSGVLYFI